MPYHVVKHGAEFCVEKKTDGKSFGCHPTREQADKQLAALYASEARHMKSYYLRTAADGYTVRRETLNGRPHVVAPVVALVEGVIHAMNSKHGNELVSYDVFSEDVARWEGLPLFEGHPLVDGRPVRGNTPAMRGASFGTVRNPSLKDQQLHLEAWLDEELAKQKAPEMLARVQAGEPIEVSIGTLVAADAATGNYDGKDYFAKWTAMDPDHLALLKPGVTGACSREMGCGVRAAEAGDEHAGDWNYASMYLAWLEAGAETDELVRALRNIPQSVRDKMPKEDFAGPNESFPIEQQVDVHDAAQAIGRAKGDRASIKRRIIAIAYRKGFEAALPDDWKRKSDMKAAESFAQFMDTMRDAARDLISDDELEILWPNASGEDDHGRGVTGHTTPSGHYSMKSKSGHRATVTEKNGKHQVDIRYKGADAQMYLGRFANRKEAINAAAKHLQFADKHRNAQSADETSRNDLGRKLFDAGRAMDSSINSVEDYYPANDPAHVVFGCYDPSTGYTYHERPFTMSDAGVVTVGAHKIPVKQVSRWEPADGASPTVMEQHTGAPCSCKNKARTGANMKTKEQIAKFLETADDAALEALSAVAEGKTPETKPEPTEEELRAAAEARQKEISDAVTQAVEADRKKQGELRAAQEKRDASVKALVACGYKADELKDKSQDVLDGMVDAAKKVAKDTRAAIDFGGQGASRETTEDKGVPAPPDATERFRAAAAARKGK